MMNYEDIGKVLFAKKWPIYDTCWAKMYVLLINLSIESNAKLYILNYILQYLYILMF